MKTLEEIQKKLHNINFGNDGIIKMQLNNDGDYTYDNFKANKCHKFTENCCCDVCGNNKYELLQKDLRKDSKNTYYFTNVSHGTHMLDFIKAHILNDENCKNLTDKEYKDKYDKKLKNMEKWSKTPVLFVMENPSNGESEDYDTDKGIDQKHPTKSWYWTGKKYSNDDNYIYPNYFTQGEYGQLIYSIMNTFEIANGYMTNMVKCGIGYYKNNDDPKSDVYTTIDRYNDEIVNECIGKHLSREIEQLRGGKDECITIFAFGNNTYYTLLEKEKEFGKCNIIMLPHPRNRQLSNDYRKHILLSKVYYGLQKSNFYEGIENIDLKSIILKENKSDLTRKIFNEAFEKWREYNAQDICYTYGDNKYKVNEYTYYLMQKGEIKIEFRYLDPDKKSDKKRYFCYKPESGEISVWAGKSSANTEKRGEALKELLSDSKTKDLYEKINAFAKDFYNNNCEKYYIGKPFTNEEEVDSVFDRDDAYKEV